MVNCINDWSADLLTEFNIQRKPNYPMRNESCRKCGAELEIKQKCSVCREAITCICKECHFETDEQIHLQCTLMDMDYKLLDTRVA